MKKKYQKPGVYIPFIPPQPQTIIQALESDIHLLKMRGMKIYDWEQKDRAIEQVRIIGGKTYFFAVRENKED